MTPIQKARSKLLLKSPFFATLLLTSPLIADESIPTACTDMREIRYNPKFFATLTDGQIAFVLCHEVMHIALMHGLRQRERTMPLWNIACDFAINWTLKESGFDIIEGCCLDEQYKHMSAEQIYEKLKQDAASGKGSGGKEPGGLGTDLAPPRIGSKADQDKLETEVRQKVAQAANMARLAGKMPGEIERLVGEILNPQVPWQDLLRDYMTRKTNHDESWSRRNRRFASTYLPARHSEQMGEIVLIGDTSGSIGAEELNKVAAEVMAISETVRPERIRVLWADTRVAKEEVFEVGELIQLHPAGGGGTDMRVPLQYAERFEPEVVILCTDGYTPWPDSEPPFPLITCCTTNVAVPVGMVVRL